MRDERGFSLAEVLVAFLILTIVITTSLAAFLERNKRLQQAAEIVAAYQALANEAEYVRRTPYTALIAGKTTPTFESAPAELLAPLVDYKTAISVEEVKPGRKKVLLTVRWKEETSEARLEVIRVDTGGGNLW